MPSQKVLHEPSSWYVHSSADNALATATKAAVAGERHYITAVFGAYDGAGADGMVTIKEGSNIIGMLRLDNNLSGVELVFPNPIEAPTNALVSAEVTASGTGGITGYVTICGFTVD